MIHVMRYGSYCLLICFAVEEIFWSLIDHWLHCLVVMVHVSYMSRASTSTSPDAGYIH